jgi:hypothetical protein
MRTVHLHQFAQMLAPRPTTTMQASLSPALQQARLQQPTP